jgi:outer membrane protein
MKEYTEAKDLEAKYKAKSEEKGKQLEAEINRFKQEAANFRKHKQNGRLAQQKGLNYKRDNN